jgi:phosphoesterase RecJ-like protein
VPEPWFARLIFVPMKLDTALVEGVNELISTSHNILITNHINPDGDAMGSALGLASLLEAAGKKPVVIVPNEYPSFLKWMKGSDGVLNYEAHVEECEELIANADLIFHLDYNSLKRSGSLEHLLVDVSAQRVMIDHHQQPADFADLMYSDPSMSSTSEMVFHLAEALGYRDLLNKDSAEALYTGIITDTGNFRFSSTTPETHRVASALLSLGVESQIIASRVYDSNRPERLLLLARMLQKMEVLKEYNAVILSLTEKDLKDFDYQKGDTEGFVNYGLSIEGIELSIFLYPSHDKVKMSFRSKTKFDVNALARTHFNGGGHLNAAGGVSHDSVEENITRIKNVLPHYVDKLR